MLIKKMTVQPSIILAVLLGHSSFAWADQLYKWVDASGSTHYSATPPPTTAKGKAKTITIATQKTKAKVPFADQSAQTDEQIQASSDQNGSNNNDSLEKLHRIQRKAIHPVDNKLSHQVRMAIGEGTLDDYNMDYKQRTGQDLFTKEKPVSKMSVDEMASMGQKYMKSIGAK